MAKLNDYRKTLAVIAPSVLGPGAEVWVSEQGFNQLLQVIEDAAALGVELEIRSAIEFHGRLDLQINAMGTNAFQSSAWSRRWLVDEQRGWSGAPGNRRSCDSLLVFVEVLE